MITHLIDAAEQRVLVLAVHDFDADLDPLVLGVRLHSIEECRRVVETFRVRHSLLLSTNADDVRAATGGALID